MENPLLLFDKNDPFAKFHFEYLTSAPPPKLYHYTSGESLIEIIETQCLYATERSYLNDPEEFHWGLSALRESFSSNVGNKYFAKYIKQMNIALDRLDKDSLPMFVLSLSANPDLLSQWRAYADNGKGVAIGLDGKVLRDRAGFDEFIWQGDSLDAMPKNLCFSYHLLPIIYDKESRRRTLRKFLDAAYLHWQSLNKILGLKSDVPKLFKSFFQLRVRELLLSFKNPGYKEECEWRIIATPTSINEKIKYRYSSLGVTPFVRLNLAPKNELPNLRLPISKIRIGPNSPAKNNSLGIEMLCKSRNILREYSETNCRA